MPNWTRSLSVLLPLTVNEINLMNKGTVSDGILSCIKEDIEERERNAIFSQSIRNGNCYSIFSFP